MLDVLTSMFKTSAQLRLENLALRQQLIVLRRSAPKRLKLTRPTESSGCGYGWCGVIGNLP